MTRNAVSSFQPWIVVFAASLFFFYVFIQLNMFNAINPSLMATFHVGPNVTGNLSAYYFYADVIFLFPAGIILDRVSTRKLVAAAMAITVIATLLFAFCTSIWQASLCRFAIGAAGAFCLLSAVRIATRWFPPQRLALVIGLIVTLAMMGGLVAQTPLTLLTDHFGWRQAMIFDAIFGAMLWLVMWFGIKDFPRGFKKEDLLSHSAAFWPSLACIIRNPQNWLAGLFVCLMNLPVFLLGGNWGSLYLVEMDHLTREAASWVIMFFFIGLIIGSPLCGAWSDHWRRRKAPMLISALAAVIVILALMFLHFNTLGLFTIFFLLGFVSGAQVIGYPLIAESNSPQLTGTAEGFSSVLIMAGGFTVPWFADLMNWHWSHHYVDNVPLYSSYDFDIALAIMPIAFIVAFLVALFIKETHCKNIS